MLKIEVSFLVPFSLANTGLFLYRLCPWLSFLRANCVLLLKKKTSEKDGMESHSTTASAPHVWYSDQERSLLAFALTFCPQLFFNIYIFHHTTVSECASAMKAIACLSCWMIGWLCKWKAAHNNTIYITENIILIFRKKLCSDSTEEKVSIRFMEVRVLTPLIICTVTWNHLPVWCVPTSLEPDADPHVVYLVAVWRLQGFNQILHIVQVVVDAWYK